MSYDIKADTSSLRSVSFKESGFTPETFRTELFDVYKIIADPNIVNNDKNRVHIPAPEPYSKLHGGFFIGDPPGSPNPLKGNLVEKPSYLLPTNTIYFPMDSNLNGITSKNYMESYTGSSKDNLIGNVGDFGENHNVKRPYVDYFGAFTYKSSIKNLLDNIYLNYWSTSGLNVSELSANIVSDPQGIEIIDNGTYTSDHLFKMPFTIKETGNYCLSCYFRASDNSGKVIITSPYITNEANVVQTGSAFPKGENITINTIWQQTTKIVNLNPGKYYVNIRWPYSVERNNTTLKMCGLRLIESSYNWHYTARKSKYLNEDNNIFPLLFDLNNIMIKQLNDPNQNLSTRSWVLSYKRYRICDNPSRVHFVDSLGGYKWGFQEGNLYLGTSKINAPSNYNPFNTWEIVSLVFNKGTTPKENKLTVYYTSENYLIKGPSIVNPDVSLFSIKEPTTTVSFNLGLGSYVENGKLNVTPGIYKDLIFSFGNELSDKDKLKEANDHMLCDYFSVGRTEGINTQANGGFISVRASSIVETLED